MNKMTKKCARCNENKPLSSFYKNKHTKNGYSVYCKECNKIICQIYHNTNKKEVAKRVKNKHMEIKQQLVDYKGGKCSFCGYNKCLASLTFHHCKGKKKFNLSADSFCKYTLDELKKEADKCILVCFNCHMEIHFGNNGDD